MPIVFFGTPQFAVASLRALRESGEDIGLVITQTDKVQGRGHKISAPPVKIAAQDMDVRVLQPGSLKSSAVTEELIFLKPEFIVVVAYGKILPRAILDIPVRGCINVHASLLPNYRGAAPIPWAIIRGEQKTGISTMLMDEGLDTGDILLQQEIDIAPSDTAESLSNKLSLLGASLLIETLMKVRCGSVSPVPQSGEPTYAPPLKKEDGYIDWKKSASEISNLIRGMWPWPGAYCYIKNERLTVTRAVAVHGTGVPGVIAGIDKHTLLIGTGNGLISVIEVQPAGKKNMAASDYVRGRTLTMGESIHVHPSA